MNFNGKNIKGLSSGDGPRFLDISKYYSMNLAYLLLIIITTLILYKLSLSGEKLVRKHLCLPRPVIPMQNSFKSLSNNVLTSLSGMTYSYPRSWNFVVLKQSINLRRKRALPWDKSESETNFHFQSVMSSYRHRPCLNAFFAWVWALQQQIAFPYQGF